MKTQKYRGGPFEGGYKLQCGSWSKASVCHCMRQLQCFHTLHETNTTVQRFALEKSRLPTHSVSSWLWLPGNPDVHPLLPPLLGCCVGCCNREAQGRHRMASRCLGDAGGRPNRFHREQQLPDWTRTTPDLVVCAGWSPPCTLRTGCAFTCMPWIALGALIGTTDSGPQTIGPEPSRLWSLEPRVQVPANPVGWEPISWLTDMSPHSVLTQRQRWGAPAVSLTRSLILSCRPHPISRSPPSPWNLLGAHSVYSKVTEYIPQNPVLFAMNMPFGDSFTPGHSIPYTFYFCSQFRAECCLEVGTWDCLASPFRCSAGTQDRKQRASLIGWLLPMVRRIGSVSASLGPASSQTGGGAGMPLHDGATILEAVTTPWTLCGETAAYEPLVRILRPSY